MKTRYLFGFLICFMLTLTFYSCERLYHNECEQNISFDLINNTDEYYHMYFEGDQMSSNNLVGPKDFIRRYYLVQYDCNKEKWMYDDGYATVCVGQNSKKIKCTPKITVCVDDKCTPMKIIWDGSYLIVLPL